MPRDQIDSATVADVAEPFLHCARCAATVTRPAWAIAIDGQHEHIFFNPAGRVFRVICFRDAPGVVDASPLSRDFTWFAGYGWRIVICRHCGIHLGWRYEAASDSGSAAAVFFGLIKGILRGSGVSAAPDGP